MENGDLNKWPFDSLVFIAPRPFSLVFFIFAAVYFLGIDFFFVKKKRKEIEKRKH